MKLEITRSGGFAGIRLHASVDTRELPDDEAGRIADLVRRLDLDALGSQTGASRVRPDEFQYDLAVTQGDRRQWVQVRESAVTPDLRALIDLLIRLGRRR